MEICLAVRLPYLKILFWLIQQTEQSGDFFTAVRILSPTTETAGVDKMERGVLAHTRLKQGQNGHPQCCQKGCWCYLSKPVSSFVSEQRRSGRGTERWPPTWSISPSFLYLPVSRDLPHLSEMACHIWSIIGRVLSEFRPGSGSQQERRLAVKCSDTRRQIYSCDSTVSIREARCQMVKI